MLEKVMKSCNNYFSVKKEFGNFKIQEDKLYIKSKCVKGQYIYIYGSIMNDGVHKVISIGDGYIVLQNLTDEEFNGCVLLLAVPKSFLQMVSEIEEFSYKNKPSIVVSESFNNYSRTLATDADGNVQDWKGYYKNRLKEYKKIYSDLEGLRRN